MKLVQIERIKDKLIIFQLKFMFKILRRNLKYNYFMKVISIFLVMSKEK